MIDIKKYALKVIPYVIVLGIGIGAGWGLKPDVVKTEIKEKIVEVVKEDIRINELLSQISTLNRDYQEMKNSRVQEKYHKEHLETRHPDGTVVIKDTIDRNVDTVVQETKREVEVQVVEVVKEVVVTQTVTVEREVVKEVKVTPQLAQWHVGALAGIQPTFLPNLKLDNGVFGGEVEHRLVGPVFVGVWGAGTTTGLGMGGIKVSVELP